jgi:LmbE family N-acetylglucosaminyl deacetylase
MKWIYLSPHLDDAAFSCGGLIWEQVQSGEAVEIWTLFAGDPPPGSLSPFAEGLHQRWKSGEAPYAERRQEDLAACAVLRASCRHFHRPECIYRQGPVEQTYLYASEEALFGQVHPDEEALLAELSTEIGTSLDPAAQLVCPLGLGNHVDHQLARRAAETLGGKLLYYADFPYALSAESILGDLALAGWQPQAAPLSPPAMEAWKAAVAAHASQMSTFWSDEAGMHSDLETYARNMGQGKPAVRLWQPP